MRFMERALKTFHCRGALGTTVNPDTIGCVDEEIFEFGKKKSCVRIKRYPDTSAQGLSLNIILRWLKTVSSTFQDVEFDGVIITTLHQLMLQPWYQNTAQSLVNTLVLFS